MDVAPIGQWADLASVAGLVVSLVGFGVTIVGVWRSKDAAKRAEDAALQMREALLRTDTIADVSATLAIMEEVKRLQRVQAWTVLPDRYATIRRKLISVRADNPRFLESHRQTLLSAIQHCSTTEQRIEKYLANTTSTPPGVAKLNELISMQIDRLEEVLTYLRRERKA